MTKLFTKNNKLFISNNNSLIKTDYEPPKGEIEITENGEYDISKYETVNVNVYDMMQERIDTGNTRYMFYDDTITDEFLSKFDFSKPITSGLSLPYLFAYAYVDEAPSCLSTIENAEYLFIYYRCRGNNLNLDLSEYNNIINASYLCTYSNAVSIKFTSMNCTNFKAAFWNCNSLETLDISTLDNCNVSDTSIWGASHSLKKIIIRNMNKVPTFMSEPFYSCEHFTGKVSSSNPEGLKDGKLYVPDNMVDQLKSHSKWSAFADIIFPLSTLEE